MFTVFAIILTILAIIMVPHGGNKFTPISHTGAALGIFALILWACVFIALAVRLIGWLWVYAP